MPVGHARISKAGRSQSPDLQGDARAAVGVLPDRIHGGRAPGARDDRPVLETCLRSLRDGAVLVAWKLDRLGRMLAEQGG